MKKIISLTFLLTALVANLIFAEEITLSTIMPSGGAASSFGAWDSTKAKDVVYKALTDGLIVIVSQGGDQSYYEIRTDSNPLPTTVRIRANGWASWGVSGHSMCPVRKGDYWIVATVLTGGVYDDNLGTGQIYWLPLGN